MNFQLVGLIKLPHRWLPLGQAPPPAHKCGVAQPQLPGNLAV